MYDYVVNCWRVYGFTADPASLEALEGGYAVRTSVDG